MRGASAAWLDESNANRHSAYKTAAVHSPADGSDQRDEKCQGRLYRKCLLAPLDELLCAPSYS